MAKIGRQGDGGGGPRKFTDVKELERLCGLYIEDCKNRDKPVTMVGLACYLDCSKDTLNEYRQGTYDDDSSRFSAPLIKVLQAAEADATERLYSKHTIGAMFVLKCNHGYIERQHLTVDGDVKVSIEDLLSDIN